MKTKTRFVSSGIPSLFLTLAVLCTAVLAMMSYQTSVNDMALSRQALTQTQAYYDAWNTFTDLYPGLKEYLKTESPENVTMYSEYARWDEEAKNVIFTIPYTDTQALEICISKDEKEITSQRSISIGEWNPDIGLSLYRTEE